MSVFSPQKVRQWLLRPHRLQTRSSGAGAADAGRGGETVEEEDGGWPKGDLGGDVVAAEGGPPTGDLEGGGDVEVAKAGADPNPNPPNGERAEEEEAGLVAPNPLGALNSIPALTPAYREA